MNNDELTKLEELLKTFRRQLDSDWSVKIKEAGWPDSEEVYRKGNDNLELVDTVINQVSLYKSANKEDR